MNLFTVLKIGPRFRTDNTATWPSCPAYVDAKQKVVSMKVIENCVECAVKLAIDFNNVINLSRMMISGSLCFR